MKDSPRKEILNKIAHAIGKIELAHPVRVGIDGLRHRARPLADELAGVLQEKGKRVVRADSTANPPEIRHRQGPMSVEGYRGFIRLHGSQEKFCNPGTGGDRRYALEWRPS